MITGFCTPEGTKRFLKRGIAHKKNYNSIWGLMLSNVGMGTYLGDSDDKTDAMVKNAVKDSISAGINVIDTAINYRGQRAERSIGKAISELINEGKIARDEVFISTKNGYITNDSEIKEDFWNYVNREYVKKGIIHSGDITSQYHCMTVPYLGDQLDRSLKNLQMDCIDLMYIHNAVEGQIKDSTTEEFLYNLKKVFEFYESKRKEGKIQSYGMATWECFRVTEDNSQYMPLWEILNLAKQVGGQNHGFRFIQLPFNMYLDQAFILKNQKFGNEKLSFLNASKKNNIAVFTSVPLMQGKLLAPGVMPEFGTMTAPRRALQFIRSTPGVTAPIVGQKSPHHLKENLEIMKIPPMDKGDFSNLLKDLIK